MGLRLSHKDKILEGRCRRAQWQGEELRKTDRAGEAAHRGVASV